MSMYHVHSWCLQRPEEDVESPRTGDRQFWVLCGFSGRASSALGPWVISSAAYFCCCLVKEFMEMGRESKGETLRASAYRLRIIKNIIIVTHSLLMIAVKLPIMLQLLIWLHIIFHSYFIFSCFPFYVYSVCLHIGMCIICVIIHV